ncbi:type II secretion system F family protein [Streptomyces sp. NPDC002054]|uniref:type II secretion system F family protein n=1 Tax=Streptomyces sp. NPDC002054 TaxID=3154663 RepID=UPI003326E0D6
MDGSLVHRLGMALSLPVAALWLVSVCAGRVRERAVLRRAGLLLPVEPGPGGTRPPVRRGRRGRWGRWARLRRRWGRAGRADPGEAERQLPFAADLLAACLAAGAGPVEAAEVVGESLGGPVGERLALAGAELRLGAEPDASWGRLAEIPGAGALADCLDRAARTGAPAAEPVARLAAALRAERARRATAGAQRAAVLVTAPVGLCFLPAFLAVGVAPVVIGMASGLLSGT